MTTRAGKPLAVPLVATALSPSPETGFTSGGVFRHHLEFLLRVVSGRGLIHANEKRFARRDAVIIALRIIAVAALDVARRRVFHFLRRESISRRPY